MCNIIGFPNVSAVAPGGRVPTACAKADSSRLTAIAVAFKSEPEIVTAGAIAMCALFETIRVFVPTTEVLGAFQDGLPPLGKQTIDRPPHRFHRHYRLTDRLDRRKLPIELRTAR